MSQISPPIRILLVCAVAFMGAWMLFLRPKDDAVPPVEPAPNTQTDAPAVSGPGKAVEAAQDAADAASGESAAAATGTKAPEAGNAAKGGTIPASDLKGLPTSVRRAIRQNDVLVLLFWNRKSADDRAVRSALRDVDRWDGRVHVEATPIRRISRYGRITRGADVEQSPTIVVVDPELHAETLVGYADTPTIDQMVVDALRNTTGLFTSSYLREINTVCVRHNGGLIAIPSPHGSGSELAGFMSSYQRRLSAFRADFSAVAAPKRFRSLKRAAVADFSAYATLIADWKAFLGPRPTVTRAVSSLDRFAGREKTILRRFNRRMDAEHVLSCGTDA